MNADKIVHDCRLQPAMTCKLGRRTRVPSSCVLAGVSVVFLFGNIYLLTSVFDGRSPVSQYESRVSDMRRERRTQMMKKSLEVLLVQADMFRLSGDEWRLRDNIGYLSDQDAKLRRLMDDEHVANTKGNSIMQDRQTQTLRKTSQLDKHLVSSDPKLDLRCADLAAITDLQLIGSGYTKAAYRGTYKNRPLVIKTVSLVGHDMLLCEKRTLEECYVTAAGKILKEIALLRSLNHTNSLQVMYIKVYLLITGSVNSN